MNQAGADFYVRIRHDETTSSGLGDAMVKNKAHFFLKKKEKKIKLSFIGTAVIA